MRLHKRTIRTISDHKITQLLLENGKVVAEFHSTDMYAVFLRGISSYANLSVYDEDTCQFVVGTLDQLDGVMAPAILKLEEAGMRDAASLLRREGK